MSEHARPHVVYVAWGFPPSRTGGVHRALATANAFAADGWRVSVVTAPREVFLDVTGADEALESLVDPRVEVHRVPFSWPAQATDLRTFGAARVLAPRLWAKSRSWRDLRAFPEVGYGPWRHWIEDAVLRLHATAPVNLVVATTNPQVSITPGLRLHADAGVPYVVDYRDAWTLHTYSGRRLHAPGSPQAQWEARSFAGAAEVWFVNEPLRRWHADQYPDVADRMRVVMNGYDRDLPAPPRVAAPDGPVRFGYLGTMTPVVPLRELVDGWRAARSAHPALEGCTVDLRGYLGYYATPDPVLAALVDEAAASGMTYGGPVSKTAVADTYATFDALVLLLGGGGFVTSGKVFEYMSTGLPIVSVLTPGNAAAEVLAGYPRCHAASSLDPADVAAAFASAAADARTAAGTDRAAQAQEFARRYRRDVQLAPRIATLRALVGAA